MGCVPSKMGNKCSASTTIANCGEHTQHCAWGMVLKLDTYQPKYANIPMTWTVTPPPQVAAGQKLWWGKYGVGTKMSSTNIMGAPENITVQDAQYPTSISFNSNGIIIAYTFVLLVTGQVQMNLSMTGPNMGLFTDHMRVQVNTMKAVVEKNFAAILADCPVEGTAAAPPAAAKFCPECGHALTPGAAFCSNCGTKIPQAAGVAFVEVPEHQMGQQGSQMLTQQSMMQAQAQMNRHHHHHY